MSSYIVSLIITMCDSFGNFRIGCRGFVEDCHRYGPVLPTFARADFFLPCLHSPNFDRMCPIDRILMSQNAEPPARQNFQL